MMRNRLIRWLGGTPWPTPGRIVILCNNTHSCVGIQDFENIDDAIRSLGGVPLPKAGDGQYLRSPAVCKMPVRKTKATEIKSVILDEIPPEGFHLNPKQEELIKKIIENPVADHRANLCDVCKASAQDCRKAVKETDQENNTVKCTEYK